MGETGSVFLGVERSATGRRWRTRLEDDRTALGIAQRHGLPEIVARVLASRCLDETQVPAFLEPRLREQFTALGLQNCRCRGLTVYLKTETYVNKKAEKDGVTTAMLVEALRNLGLDYMVSEGYSPEIGRAHV